MATSPQTTQAGDNWSQLVTRGAIPADLMVQGVTEATKLTYLTRRWNKFTWYLHKNFPSKTTKVKDRKYLTRELIELDRFYTCSVGSSNLANNPNHKVIGIPNQEAVQIQPQDILYLRGIYAYATFNPMVSGQVEPSQGGTLGDNIGPDIGTDVGGNPTGIRWSRQLGPDGNGNYYTDPEQVLVEDIGDADSAGVGNTTITLRRFYAGPSAFDEGGAIVREPIVNTALQANMNTGNQEAAIRSGDVLLRGTNAFYEGTGYPSGVYKNPTSDNNFTQLYKYAMEKTLESDIAELYIKKRPFDISKWLTLQRFNRDREYSNIIGRKGTTKDPLGREIFVMGGVREFIPKDEDHYFIYRSSTMQWPSLQDMSRPLLNLNNSGIMTGIIGVDLDVELRKSFWGDQLFYNKEESKKFNMEVNTLYLSGIKINLITSQIMSEAGFGSEMLLLDMGNKDNFEPITHQGWDMKVDKDIGEKGSNIYKEGIQGMFGLRRRRKDHHAIINFENAMP